MTTKELPVSSGYAIVNIYSTHQRLKAVPPTDLPDDDRVAFGWDWRWIERRAFEVRVIVTVEASRTRPSLISADVVGRFRQIEDHPSLQLEDFVTLQAVAILLPYARQYLSNLTSNTLPGSYYLPSINVAALRKDFDLAGATAAKQNLEQLPGSRRVSSQRAPLRKRNAAR